MSNPSEIAQGISLLKVAFPNYQPDLKLTAELWSSVLGDLPGDTLKAAIMQCLTEGNRQFAPSIGEIRGAALRLNAKAAGIPEAWQAYEEVCQMPAKMEVSRLIMEDGQNIIETRALKFSHPLVEQVARMIGWPGQFPTDMPGADRAQFVKAYESEFARLLSDVGRPPLVAEYIDSRRQIMGGNALQIAATVTKQLEVRR